VLRGEKLCYATLKDTVDEAESVNASTTAEGDACSALNLSCRWEESMGDSGAAGDPGGGGREPGRHVEARAEILDGNTLRCTTPAWPYPAGPTRLRIIDSSDSTILGYVPSYTEEAVYHFLPDIRNISAGEGATSRQILAAGNADVAIAGAGLDPQQTYTAFLLADSYNRAQRTLRLQAYACESVSTTLIRCTFPPPPHDLEAQPVQVQVYHAGGSAVGAEVTCCGESGCACAHMAPAIYVEAWTRASASSVYAHGCTTDENPCPDMQQFLYIDGAGFSTTGSYACSFTAVSGGGVNRTTAAHVPLSPSRIACHLPGNAGVAGFTGFQGTVLLSLLRSRSGVGVPAAEVQLYGSSSQQALAITIKSLDS